VTYVTMRVTLHLVSRLSNILDEPNARPLGVSLGACQGVKSGAGGLIDPRDQDWVFGSESGERLVLAC